MKKLVSVLLALVMCLSVTTLAWAEDTLPNGVTFGGANTVYWVSGGADGYAETLKAALTEAHQANGNSITIYCKPSAMIATSDPSIPPSPFSIERGMASSGRPRTQPAKIEVSRKAMKG